MANFIKVNDGVGKFYYINLDNVNYIYRGGNSMLTIHTSSKNEAYVKDPEDVKRVLEVIGLKD